MKIVFSTKNVNRASFLDMCRYSYDYGFAGFEIYDAIKERKQHHDSILRRDRIADAKESSSTEIFLFQHSVCPPLLKAKKPPLSL